VPLVATQEFHLTSDTLIFSFIVAFGVVKALANVASGDARGSIHAKGDARWRMADGSARPVHARLGTVLELDPG